MYCKKCGSELPQGSDFCPYCMNKLVAEKPAEPVSAKKSVNKKVIILSAAGIVIALGIVIGSFLLGSRGSKKESESSGAASSAADVMSDLQTSAAPQTESTTEAQSTEPQTTAQQTTTSAPKTTAVPQNKTPDKNTVIKSYERLIDRYISDLPADDTGFCDYYIYDINGNGIKEIIILSSSSFQYEIYTYLIDGSYKLGSVRYPNYDLMIPKDGNGLLHCYAHMGYCSVTRLTVTGDNKINQTPVTSADTEDYDAVFDKYAVKNLEECPINDLSLLYSM